MRPEDPSPPVISVVIPTRDRRAVLERCLASLARQTMGSFEIIVVDDASSDGTADMLAAFADAHPGLHLRVLTNETRAGSNVSRNRAVRVAGGAYVAFLDSDCVAAPDWLERLHAGFDAECVAAVTGLVTVPTPANVFELAYKGTNRVPDRGRVRRLAGCNMCIRRDALLAFPLDEDLAYGCDEEGIHLRLRAAGWAQRVVPDAIVCHHHRFTGRALLRHAFIGGVAAAWFVYKYRLPTRLDVAPFLLAWITLPLALIRGWLLVLPALFFVAALVAVLYNEVSRKAKTAGEIIRCLPVLILYYQARVLGYASMGLRLRLHDRGIERIDLRAIRRAVDVVEEPPSPDAATPEEVDEERPRCEQRVGN